MPRKVNIVSTCSNGVRASSKEMLARFCALLDDISSIKPDVVCLPEFFAESGGERNPGSEDMAEEVLELLCGKAREMGSYLVAGSNELFS